MGDILFYPSPAKKSRSYNAWDHEIYFFFLTLTYTAFHPFIIIPEDRLHTANTPRFRGGRDEYAFAVVYAFFAAILPARRPKVMLRPAAQPASRLG